MIIELNDSLIKNQTYIISINRNLIDEHKVKIKQEIQLAFSTGEKIDHGSIKGKIYHSSLLRVLKKSQFFFLGMDDISFEFVMFQSILEPTISSRVSKK